MIAAILIGLSGVICFVAGLIAGTMWGRKIEQKALASALNDFKRLDTDARAAVSRLYRSLPAGLRKYL